MQNYFKNLPMLYAAPTDVHDVELIGTFYVQQNAKLDERRSHLGDYDRAKEWLPAGSALRMTIDVRDITTWRRRFGSQLSKGIATYKRPDSVQSSDQLYSAADCVVPHFQIADNGIAVISNAPYSAVATPQDAPKIRMHTSHGDVPAPIVEAITKQSHSVMDLVLHYRLYFDTVAASRAWGATSALSHPILLWRDRSTGDLHWYARGYEAIVFPIMRKGLSAPLSEKEWVNSPVYIDYSPFIAYAGNQYDLSVAVFATKDERKSDRFESTGASISAFVKGCLALGVFISRAEGILPRSAKAVAHTPDLDPYKLSHADCQQVADSAEAIARRLGVNDLEDILNALLTNDLAPSDIPVVEDAAAFGAYTERDQQILLRIRDVVAEYSRMPALVRTLAHPVIDWDATPVVRDLLIGSYASISVSSPINDVLAADSLRFNAQLQQAYGTQQMPLRSYDVTEAALPCTTGSASTNNHTSESDPRATEGVSEYNFALH